MNELVLLGLIAQEQPTTARLGELYTEWMGGGKLAPASLYRYVEFLARAGLIFAEQGNSRLAKSGRTSRILKLSRLGEAELKQISTLISLT